MVSLTSLRKKGVRTDLKWGRSWVHLETCEEGGGAADTGHGYNHEWINSPREHVQNKTKGQRTEPGQRLMCRGWTRKEELLQISQKLCRGEPGESGIQGHKGANPQCYILREVQSSRGREPQEEALKELVGVTERLLSWPDDWVVAMNLGLNPASTTYQPCHTGQLMNSLSLFLRL